MGNRGAPLLGMIGFSFLTLIIAFSILGGEGNTLGGFARYLAFGSCLVGVLAPRKALYYLIILAAYSDLLKRTLIFDTSFNYEDIMFMRGLCPITLAGIVLGVLLRRFFDRSLFQNHGLTLFLGPSFILVVMAFLGRSQGLMTSLQLLADGLSYIMLLFVVPSLFRTSEEMVNFIRYTLWIFVPVALYGVYQQIFGLSNFEILYLKSGFTTLIKHLDDERPRPFSTLTDTSILATVCAVCACYALMLWRVTPVLSPRKPMGFVTAWALWLVFVIGCLATVSRLPNMNWILPVCLLPLLRSGFRSLAMYATAVVSFVLICIFAHDLIDLVRLATEWGLNSFGDSGLGQQVARFHTYVPRLDGFHDMAHNPKMWTMFGYGTTARVEMVTAGDFFSHDIVSSFLLDRGWVPLILVVTLISYFMVRLHLAIYKLRGKPEFNFCIWLLAINGGLVFHDVFGGNITSTFPVNYFFWSSWAIILTVILQSKPGAASETVTEEFAAQPLSYPAAFSRQPRAKMPTQF